MASFPHLLADTLASGLVSLGTVDYLVIGVYFAFVLGIGFYLKHFIFGVLISGAGIYGYFVPPSREQRTVLGNLHAALWWGAIMFVIGIFNTAKFRPRK